MSIYQGIRRNDDTVKVTVNGRSLSPRLDLFNHSPSGFEWGYGGSGPAQLALAILAHHFGQSMTKKAADEKAVRLHQEFKRRFVAATFLREAEWWAIGTLTIAVVVAEIESGQPAGEWKPICEREKTAQTLEAGKQ